MESITMAQGLEKIKTIGDAFLLASLKEGDSIGEINLFDPATASATAVARSPSLICALMHTHTILCLTGDGSKTWPTGWRKGLSWLKEACASLGERKAR